EAFASKKPVGRAVLDALGVAAGFTIALVMMGVFREVLGNGTILGYPLFGEGFEPWVIMILPPGGFFTLGFILLGLSWWEERKKAPERP
ncbi:MAG: electron transport complex subunit RsxE, partial [Pseudomonadales bacterium]|nr:electron transport complex subunit RsxE [Pseudomonadales bacterium]NIX07569.1 electron transport complex subunit RsxE [Pseudomonadales bacterium]